MQNVLMSDKVGMIPIYVLLLHVHVAEHCARFNMTAILGNRMNSDPETYSSCRIGQSGVRRLSKLTAMLPLCEKYTDL